MEDRKKLKEVFDTEDITAVMHFAAFIEVGESVQEPAKYYENNVVKVTKLLDQMVESGVKNFIFSSTAATFGEPVKEKIDETHQQLPINPYGKSKLMVEKILEDYDAAYGLKSVVLRYFNASGSDKDGIIGESHIPETHLIPLILQAASGKRESIKIFGDDYPTKDGTCIRDFVHVYDLAKAHILGMEKMLKENKSLNYNLGSGEGFSVKEVIEKENIDYIELEEAYLYGEDFSFFSRLSPINYSFLGLRNEEKNYVSGLHTPTFNFDEKILKVGVQYYLGILKYYN